jgi:hypothetical protein
LNLFSGGWTKIHWNIKIVAASDGLPAEVHESCHLLESSPRPHHQHLSV